MLPGTFLWLSLSLSGSLSLLSLFLSVECEYVHADTPVGYLTGLDLSPLTYVWSFCKHVSTGKHSTCMHNTHTNAHSSCLYKQFIHFFLVCLEISSFYSCIFAFKMKAENRSKKCHYFVNRNLDFLLTILALL